MANMVDAIWSKAAAFAGRWLRVAVLTMLVLAAVVAAPGRRPGRRRSSSAGWLPPVGQQLLDLAVQLRGQPGEHVLEVGPGLVPFELGRLQQPLGTIPTQNGRTESQGWIERVGKRQLLRVLTEGDVVVLVITAMATSKFEKYGVQL